MLTQQMKHITTAMNSGGAETETVECIVQQLSLDQKLSLLTGATLWKLAKLPNMHQITVSDGPHGLRKPKNPLVLSESYPATCFPTAAALACSWNEEMIQRVGIALSAESQHYNVQILLGPGMNLKRHPAGGRNFEYFSEDPLLTARLAAAYVRGIQSTGATGACIKHFAVNNQESHRFVVDAIVDERTLRELYYRHFEHVVKETQPASIMCSYNRLNGLFCSEHAALTNTILRDEWGYEGIVMTDWGATNDRVAAIQAGLDLEMPGSHGVHNPSIRRSLQKGRLTMEQIDTCCRRMIPLMQRYGHSTYETDEEAAAENPIDWKAHYHLAHAMAMECAVLLRNENQLLPLQSGTRVAIIGDFANQNPRFQGMGSSAVCSSKVVTVLDELKRFTEHVEFAQGYYADDDSMEQINANMLKDAVEVAQNADVVLLCIGLPEIMESEGFDRTHLQLPAQHNALVHACAKANPNVVVVLSNGGVVEMPWYNQVPAILEGYLLGEAGGAAVVDLIFGVQSPSGKLSETFPEIVQDIPADEFFPGTENSVEYREGLNVGYRYFNTAQKAVRYPFGHGLSYTTFEYSDLQINVLQDESTGISVEVMLSVTNTGSVAAKEVVQCYVHDVHATVYRPAHELKDFRKVYLEPGEAKTVRMVLTVDAFSFYDIGNAKWITEKGTFEVQIGSSSRDIRLQGCIELTSGVEQASEIAQNSYPPIENIGSTCSVDVVSFSKRFGTLDVSVQATFHPQTAQVSYYHRNTLLKELAQKLLIGRFLLFMVYRGAAGDIAPGPNRKRQELMIMKNVECIPLRVLVLFSRGSLSFDLLDALILLMNGSFYQSFATLANCMLRLEEESAVQEV